MSNLNGFFGLNPVALIFWMILSLGSYVIWGSFRAAAIGLLIGLAFSLLGDILDSPRKYR